MILAVAIDAPLRRTFDYRCPAAIDPQVVLPGTRILVPFGRRRVVGVLVEYREHSEIPASKLKAAIEAIDSEPTFNAHLLQLLSWSADYYRHPIGEVFAAALPGALRDDTPLHEEELWWRLTRLGRTRGTELVSARATKQRKVLDFLSGVDGAAIEALVSATGTSPEVVRQMAARELIEKFPHTIQRAEVEPTSNDALALNEHQRAAVERVRATFDSFASHLLYGVTGSGKTEVYLHLIQNVLRRDQQALVLVPEIALTPQLLHRFKSRFNTGIAVMHSGLNESERLSAWREAREGSARIVIGTRSAVFAPLGRPGLIVIDEEHDPSFKQHEGFRYSARDLALVRAQRLGIPIVLGSATPSLETLARAQKQPQWLSRLPERAANARAPKWTLIDLRKTGQTQGIATPVMLTMRNHLHAGGQVMLFLNRRGYAPVLFCPNCGWGARCKRCDAHLTVHQRAGALICHHCGAEHQPIDACPDCFGAVKPVGQGTERIEETIVQMFPDVPMARLDRDSTRRKGELEAVLGRVNSGEVSILVGTQMLTKGHDFPNVTLVVVLNADQGLFSTDFRASERLAQTIVQVAGRAGRAERRGEVMIQTEYPDHPLLALLMNGGYDAFAAGALEEREQCRWPPFARLALLRAEATAMRTPMDFLEGALRLGRKQNVTGVKLLGPAPAVMERRAGRHRAQLLIHANAHGPMQRFLQEWIPSIEALPTAKRVRWSIDVDAAELF
jgi:primosomal protein N' (replication factor Y) (superfamily II helicase)